MHVYFLANFLVLLGKSSYSIAFLCLPNWDNDIDLQVSDRGTNEP